MACRRAIVSAGALLLATIGGFVAVGPAAAANAVTVTVTPHDGLVDQQQVAVDASGFGAGDAVLVGECLASEADTCDPTAVGTSFNFVSADQSGEVSTSIVLRRGLTPSGGGVVDCATAAGTCVVIARSGGVTTTSPLTFDDSTPLPPPPSIDVSPATGLGSRQIVHVTGANFSPNAPLSIVECPAGSTPFTGGCSFSTRRAVDADGSGGFDTTFEVRRFARVSGPGGFHDVDCASGPGACSVSVAGFVDPSDSASAPLSFDPSAPAASPPSVSLSKPGPFLDGESVTVTGGGFPPGVPVDVLECQASAAATADPSGCDTGKAVPATTDDAGGVSTAFVLARTLSPSFDCQSSADACSLVVVWKGETPEVASVALTFVDPAVVGPPLDPITQDQTTTTAPPPTVLGESFTNTAAGTASGSGSASLARTGADAHDETRYALLLCGAGLMALGSSWIRKSRLVRSGFRS